MSDLIDLVDLIAAKVELRRLASGWGYNGFTVTKSCNPYAEYSHIANGLFTVVPLASDEGPLKSRHNTADEFLQVQVAYQIPCDQQSYTEVSGLLRLTKEFFTYLRKEIDPLSESFTWVRKEDLRDDNGTPFTFVAMRNVSVFERYATITYKTILE